MDRRWHGVDQKLVRHKRMEGAMPRCVHSVMIMIDHCLVVHRDVKGT